jgi:hypothetical protein
MEIPMKIQVITIPRTSKNWLNQGLIQSNQLDGTYGTYDGKPTSTRGDQGDGQASSAAVAREVPPCGFPSLPELRRMGKDGKGSKMFKDVRSQLAALTIFHLF